MRPYKPTRIERFVNNTIYFAVKGIGGSFVVWWLVVWLFGFTNTMLYMYSCGITGSLLWDIKCIRERRMIEASVLHYFGVPENGEFLALK